MTISEYDPLYNSEIYIKALHAAHTEQEKNWPFVQQLHCETSGSRRQELYDAITAFNPALFELTKNLFEQRHIYTLSKGRNSLLELVTTGERGRLHWRNLFHTEVFTRVRRNFSKTYAEQRRNALGLPRFHPWDFWLQNKSEIDDNPHHIQLTSDTESVLAVLKKFLDLLGYGYIFERIHWVLNKESTVARLNIDKFGKLVTSLHISESSCHSPAGSLSYFSCAAHELGHIVQAHTIRNPCHDQLTPPIPLIEVISMLFQKLFLLRQNLETLAVWESSRLDRVLRKIAFEDVESLARYLCYLEFEVKMYDLIAKNLFTPDHVSKLWKNCRSEFFGFEPNAENDHGWQGSCFYLVYSPFYQRSYIVGEILSRLLLKKFLYASKDTFGITNARPSLRDLITICSDKGGGNTWQDFERACGIRMFSQSFLLAEISSHMTLEF